MNTKLFLLSGLCLTTSLITGFAVSSAQAGFQWNPPPAKAPIVVPGSVEEKPESKSNGSSLGPLTPMPGDTAVTPISVEPLAEMDISDRAKPVPPVTKTNAVSGMKSINVETDEAPQNITPVEAVNAESDLMLPVPGEMAGAPQGQDVQGFGKDIPLAVALTQIVPPMYKISFDPGLDQGKPVSWQGGRAWTEVASDMLAKRKLHGSVNGNVLTISEGNGTDISLPSYAPVTAGMTDDPQSRSVTDGKRPVLDLSAQNKWEAKPGEGLRQTLQSWSRTANVELAWQDVPDAPVGSAFSYNGTFDQAVDSLLALYGGGANEPHGKLYPNLPEGPSVLVIGSN